jgi:hypothetical protein
MITSLGMISPLVFSSDPTSVAVTSGDGIPSTSATSVLIVVAVVLMLAISTDCCSDGTIALLFLWTLFNKLSLCRSLELIFVRKIVASNSFLIRRALKPS